jgi:superfamily I DNA/RNA helicase
MSDLLANLNVPQLQAVTLPPVHALILAGAGSGKTRVLTTRIACLMSTNQVGPHGVLAVTFTRKAATELRERVREHLLKQGNFRLANAMGLQSFGNVETRVPAEAFAEIGVHPEGELWAAMLDTKQSWDDLIARHAPARASSH